MPFITILGKATADDPDKYGLSLDTSNSSWTATEPGGAQKIFITKSGKYLFKPIPDRGTYLNDAAEKKVVCFLRDLEPGKAKVGDSGNGNAYETARTINWKVESL